MSDEHVLGSGVVRYGRIRPPTDQERTRADDLLRPDAVIALSASPPTDASDFELRLSALIDGVRPVARIKKKSGLTSAQVRSALSALRGRKLLMLVGIVEEAYGPLGDEIAAELNERAREEATIPRGRTDYIPPHVMSEIAAMLEEEARAEQKRLSIDDETSPDDERTEEVNLRLHTPSS
jgi:hypothetical protein